MDLFGMIVFGGGFVVLLAGYGVGLLARWRVELTSPRGIVQRLSGPDRRHVVRFDARRFTWNPALPLGTKNRLYGPGTATYSLDEHGRVQLDFVSRSGRAGQWVGPLPAELLEPPAEAFSPYSIAKPALAILAFLGGLLTTSGSTTSRLAVGSALGILGWVVAAVTLMTAGMVFRTREFAAQRE